jgi:hypothetical protein
MSALDSELFWDFRVLIFPILDHLFNLRFAAKELHRNAKKCEKDEQAEKNKLTAALKVTI